MATETAITPKYLTDEELAWIARNERCKKSPTLMNLLHTLALDRDEHKFIAETLNGRVAELTKQVQWFETTYNTRANEPLRVKRIKGDKCPKCGKDGAVHIGESWACFDCGEQWSSNP